MPYTANDQFSDSGKLNTVVRARRTVERLKDLNEQPNLKSIFGRL